MRSLNNAGSLFSHLSRNDYVDWMSRHLRLGSALAHYMEEGRVEVLGLSWQLACDSE